MPPGRSSTPLFEVLSRGGPTPPSRGGGGDHDHHDHGHHDDDNHEHHGDDEGSVHARRGRILVPVPTIYAAGALVLSLLVLVFVAGYQYGQTASDMSDRTLDIDDVMGGGERIVEPPRGSGAGSGSGLVHGGNGSDSDGESTVVRRGDGLVRSFEGPYLTAEGAIEADPRVVGSNYLELATLPRSQVLDALSFLRAQGVDAVAVSVGLDRGGGGRNTSDRYRLISLGLAVPSGSYSRMADERRRHEQLVARLGKRWVEEAGGTADFDDTLWKKYDP